MLGPRSILAVGTAWGCAVLWQTALGCGGSDPVLPFLGIEINTRAMTIALDQARLDYVQGLCPIG